MSINGMPSPGKGYCPICNEKELFVPMYVKKGDCEMIYWQCASCGFTPSPKVKINEYPGGHLFSSEL
ncbi:hypothetical protein RJ40_00115 [Methanofollis aquaemaris]|uniref:Uncharacterized protein n=1 Tax=Methanofollis aquaemaris TaxID=126734 RepID=A0A8A3S2Z2_9EURY|nr:hypothetical protein RJ40_00115 [Methanofollis aquaemaris]